MSDSGTTAVAFTLLSWVLLWWLVFELWPELRAAKLRLQLRRLQLEQTDDEMFQTLKAAARHADEFRWLPLTRAPAAGPLRPDQERAAWEIVKHVAWGAPWLWLWLRRPEARQRWMHRAWGLARRLAARESRS